MLYDTGTGKVLYEEGFMTMKTINSATFMQMIQMGATNLANNRDIINKLNVFPVPDGDTGTNMNLSMTSGVNEMKHVENETLDTVVSTFVKGLLMGARGNSGVILSQLFRGFSKGLQNKHEMSSTEFAHALGQGVQVAYQSVTNPVEGTILTVAKDVANVAETLAAQSVDMPTLMEKIVEEAQASLERTTDLLPILKEVGVVDSGGKGLVVIYEGFLAATKGEALPEKSEEVTMEALVELEHERSVQSFINKESIEFGYCTEFFVEFDSNKTKEQPFSEEAFRNELSEYGDSLLVASDEEFVKVHIHTEYPGNVMTIGQKYGDLAKIDIENMRKQYDSIVGSDEKEEMQQAKEFGIIAVTMGEGMRKMVESIGATTVIEGGQTMNPSTEELLAAVERTNATYTYILPNNKNIIMAANQVKEIATKEVIVIPSKTIPQGINALFSFDEEASVEANETQMVQALEEVKTGFVTYATRDTTVNEMEIKKNSYIGMNDDTIMTTNVDKVTTTQSLLRTLIDNDDELVTMFYGEDVDEAEIALIQEFAATNMEDVEIEFYQGNQPIYSFIIMVE